MRLSSGSVWDRSVGQRSLSVVLDLQELQDGMVVQPLEVVNHNCGIRDIKELEDAHQNRCHPEATLLRVGVRDKEGRDD